jgi:putative endonuclease
MGKHNETGTRGERIAEEYLATKGFTILHRNWRAARKEIDLIAIDGGELVFVEIKTRSGTAFGFPEEAVTLAKQAHLRAGAEAFMEKHPHYPTGRFDVISILLRNDAIKEVLHLRDAF